MLIDDTLTSEDIAAIAEEAYIFSFPMLMGYRYAFGAFLEPSLPSYRGPLNELSGEAVTLDHTFRDVVSPNADTPYSPAALDLRAEPMVLTVPEVNDRYYVMQFEDLFGTNAHYVGSRATGMKPGAYALIGPRWDGDIPDHFDAELRFETDLVFIIGRTQLLGLDDVQAVQRVMDGYELRPLSSHTGTEAPQPAALEWPPWEDDASRDERFVGYVNRLLELCQPTHPSEVELMARFARIGIEPGGSLDVEGLEEEARSALRSGVERGRATISEHAGALGRKVNGWSVTEAFGDRAWFAGDYMLRAAGSMVGWGGNDKVEAYYPMAREDSEGRPLTGGNRYRLTFSSSPPAKAFWSVTAYDTSYDGTAGYLVENPIGRYVINSTTEGLVGGDDGSLTIHIQRERPATADGEANWLPAPEGGLYLVLRIYWPEEAALDGTWTPPPIERV